MQSYNPYLPSYEYVPDGEPHVFGDRLYVFGSHDRFGGKKFCMNDYVGWSAPLDDLGNWRYEGVIYKKIQDPDNRDGKLAMYAPDVARGTDGAYYLYYSLADYDKIGVAVCSEPAGKYEFLDFVHYADGTPWGKKPGDFMPFDPGILVDDDGRIHLYAGQGPMMKKLAKRHYESHFRDTAYHVELEPDMVTLKTAPKRLLPNLMESAGTGFENHEFFEANSIRKFEGKYYFIYSSVQSHELVYAVSDRPDGGFVYGGTLVSNCDVGMDGFFPVSFLNSKADLRLKNYVGNNHGSIEKIGEDYFIFYHRHTNRIMFSRQGCAEQIFRAEDGSFAQVEMTSQGLNKKPLAAKGRYEARIACNLQSARGALYSAHPLIQNRKHPAFTQDGEDREDNPNQHIANMRKGAKAGFKYFDFASNRPKSIGVEIRGRAEGSLRVYDAEYGGRLLAEIPVSVQDKEQWSRAEASFASPTEKAPLFFVYEGKGALDFLAFTLQ